MSRTYSVKIAGSSMELTKKQSVMFKDTSDCIKFDDQLEVGGESLVIQPEGYVILDIHNDKATPSTDYNNYMIIDKDGTKYITGSETFFNNFSDIWDEMQDCNEDWGIKVYKKPSKQGNGFITCSVI